MLTHDYAEVNGVRLHYVHAGAGKLILFVHGFPEFWYQWRKQLAEFARNYFVVAPDLRGYNLSSKPACVDCYRLPLLVDDLWLLAKHLGYDKFILVAHDWGGVIAWALTLNHPQLVEKLIIINAPHPAIFERELAENPAQQQASQYVLLFRSAQAEAILSANQFALLRQPFLDEQVRLGNMDEEARQAYLKAWSQPGALTGGLNYYRAVPLRPPIQAGAEPSPDFTSHFPTLTVRVPTLVIWGEKDIYLLTGNLRGLQDYVPDLRLRPVPEGSHWVVHERPELINTYLREFIDR